MTETVPLSSSNEDLVLTTGDVARICRVAKAAVRRWIDGPTQTDRLPAYRLPGKVGAWRVLESDLRRWMERYRIPTGRLDRFVAEERAKTATAS